MNNLLRTIALLLLVFTLLTSCACKPNPITQPNMSYNFGSMDEADEWIEEHIWWIWTEVSETEDKSSMILDPRITCYQDGVVSYDDDYQLWINDREIPLEVYGSTSYPQVRVNWDLIHGDLTIPHSSKIHYVFHINGVEEVNKSVLIPSTPVFDPFDFDNVDFTSPVVVFWSLGRDANFQTLYCLTFYREDNGGTGSGESFFIEADRRSYTLDIDEILNDYQYWLESEVTIDNLTIEYFKLTLYNYEENGFNAVGVRKRAEIGENKEAKTPKTHLYSHRMVKN